MQLNPELEAQLRTLVKFFLAENAKINLSACRTEASCWIGNVLDSLSAVEAVSASGNVLDLGTGGGFPLLPLAIALPAAHFTGLDATKKKIDAVLRIVNALSLKNVDLVFGRAEELAKPLSRPEPVEGWGLRETFDVVTSRAVAEVNILLEYCSPFVKPGGQIILWKSMDIEEEFEASIRAHREFGCRYVRSHEYELPGDFGHRQLLIFEKIAKLSNQYPRPVGIAKKRPFQRLPSPFGRGLG